MAAQQKVLQVKIIELVRERPILYDKSNPQYQDSSVTLPIWQQIADEIGITGQLNYVQY